MQQHDDEGDSPRSIAMKNAQSAFALRQRIEQELILAKESLELKTEELAHTLSIMRATLESTTDGILVTDESGKVIHFNEQYLTMWKIPRETMGLSDHGNLLQMMGGEFRDALGFIHCVEAIYQSSPPESFDVLELADGRVFERLSKIQFLNEKKIGRVWSYRDVTEQRRAEAELREESRILELLNETGTSLASQLDLPTLVQAITDAATQLSGAKIGAFFYNSSGNAGNNLTLFTLSGVHRSAFDKFDHPRATPLFGPAYRGEGPVRSDDVLNDPRYGQMKPYFGLPPGHPPVRSYLAVSVISRTGDVVGSLFFGHPEVGIFSERTERSIVSVAAQAAIAIDNARLYEASQKTAKERQMLLASERFAREEIQRMSEMKDTFLANISHELRTPLNAILGWSQVLGRRNRDSIELQKGLQTIERNARMQAKLIEDLLDMSRITSGKIRLDIQPSTPVSFIEAAVETVGPAADAKGVRLELMLDPAAGPISGDPNRLQQVMWNLLSNAIKFTPKAGKVQVILARVNSHIEITVADTGIGIEPKLLPFVFDRFRQGDASTSRRFGGLGLGLAIVKTLVELHGGTVHVSSGGEGKGATFAVHLPLMVIHSRGDYPASRLHPDGSTRLISADFEWLDLSGIKVLVVDDEADARDLIRRVLEDCGADVVTAGSATEALLLIERDRPQIVVSDIGMPDVDGFEFLRRVRALGRARGGRVPAIALTAFARSEDRTRALHAGFLVHLSKPVEPSELIATVASVVGRTGQQESIDP